MSSYKTTPYYNDKDKIKDLFEEAITKLTQKKNEKYATIRGIKAY